MGGGLDSCGQRVGDAHVGKNYFSVRRPRRPAFLVRSDHDQRWPEGEEFRDLRFCPFMVGDDVVRWLGLADGPPAEIMLKKKLMPIQKSQY